MIYPLREPPARWEAGEGAVVCAGGHTTLGHLCLPGSPGAHGRTRSHMNYPTCAHTSRRPRYWGQSRAAEESHRSPGPQEGQALWAQVLPSCCPSDAQLQATGPGARAAQPDAAARPRWAEEADRNVLGSGRQCRPALDAVAWMGPLGPGPAPSRTRRGLHL